MPDLLTLIPTFGIVGVAAIIFSETGLLVGFFLPGDSLLFTAGFLASQGLFSIIALIIACVVAAILGNTLGYYLGHRFGPMIFNRRSSIFFNKTNADKAHEFFAKYGEQSLVLARFMPIVRTFTPVVAGIGKMNHHIFQLYNIIGGIAWISTLTLMGYFLGRSIPNADHYIYPIVAIIVVVSLLPSAFAYLKHRKK